MRAEPFLIRAMASALPICAAKPFRAEVFRIVDSDSFVVVQGTQQIDVRLEGIGVTKG